MRCVLTALVTIALSSAATADECNIVWWDLFLAPSDVTFEKTSEVSARLTMNNTTKRDPISFELALTTLTREGEASLEVLLGSQTVVAGGLSNQVTITLQPKSTSWLIGFDSVQTLRSEDGQTFGGNTLVTGYLICNQIQPWP